MTTKTPAKTEEKGQESLPAIIPENMMKEATQAAASILESVDVETKAALNALQEDIQPTMPFAAIRQKQIPGAIVGGFKFNDGREDQALPKLVIILGMKKGRVCWDHDNLMAPPRCKSVDGKTHLPGVPDPGIDCNGAEVDCCDKCIRRLWPKERNALAERMGNQSLRQPKKPENSPECPDVLNNLICDPEEQDIFILSLHGTSVKPLNSYLGRWKRKRILPIQLITEITSEYKQFEKGGCYVARFKESSLTPEPLLKALLSDLPGLAAVMARDAEKFDSVYEREADDLPPEDNNGGGDGGQSWGSRPEHYESDGSLKPDPSYSD